MIKTSKVASRFAALMLALAGTNAASCHAATYYVNATSGSDSASGLSTALAWKTLAKVNTSTFSAGDSILLARGETWREQLTVSSSGASNQPITIGAYGGGNAPAIVGSDLVTGWTALGNSTYRANFLTAPVNLYDGDQGPQTVPLAIQTSAAAVTANAGSWYYDTTLKQITLRLADSSDPSAHAINASVRAFGVLSSNHSFVTVQDLTIRQTKQAGIYFQNTLQPTGTEANNYNNNFNEYNTVQGCTIHNYGGNTNTSWDGGIYIRSNLLQTGTKPMLRGWRVLNNLIGRIEDTPKIDYDRGGIWVRGTTGALIAGNTVSTINKYGISVRGDFYGQGSFAPTVTNNTLTQNFTNIAITDTDNAIVTQNRIYNSAGMGIGIGNASNALVAYNVINNLVESGDKILYNGIDINNNSLNGRAYHNSIRKVASACITLEGDAGKPSNGWIVKNNIFEGSDNIESIANQHSVVYIASGVTQWTFAKNIYIDSVAHLSKAIQYPSGTYFGQAAYQTLTGDTTSVFTTDSQYISTDDLRLKNGSIAIGTAATLSDITQLTLDIGAIPYGTGHAPFTLRIPENPANTVNGIDYKYYEGAWTQLPNFDTVTPIKAGTLANFSLSPKNQADNFGFTYSGFIDVPADGFYTFYTNSDEGSKFYIGTTEVVNNGGLHTATEKEGTIGLKAGKHAFKVVYFEATGPETLEVRWAAPGMSKQLIADASLYRDPLKAGLIGWWKLDESSGTTAADSSGFNRNGTTSSVIWNPLSGKIGGSGSFSGSTALIELPDATIKNAGSALTFATWFKSSSTGVIVGVNNQHYPTTPTNWCPMLYIGTNGKLLGKIWDGTGSYVMSTQTVNNGAWHHAALVATGTTQSLYLDGVLVGTVTGNNFSIGVNTVNQFGAGYTPGWWAGNGSWMLYSGQLDDARLYNRVLNAAEIGVLAAA